MVADHPVAMSRMGRLGIGLLAVGLIAGCGSPVAGGTPQASSSNGKLQSPTNQRPSSSLPPCLTATATGCDRSNLPTRGRGSAGCHGYGPAPITATPIAFGDLLLVQPMGQMIGGHVTPIDHGYFYVKGALANPPVQDPVYSPLDGTVSVVTRSVRNGDPGGTAGGASQTATYDDYAITIEATCTFRVRFSNLVRFSGTLGIAIGQLQGNESKSPNYAVKSGELIGYTGLPTAYGIDVWVENDDITLTGFVNPAQYTAAEVWKTHMADLFDATPDPLKSQLLALDERDATPRWGKIDYDVDGKLVGNWFLVGSGGYAGLQQGGEGYWVGHLAVAYNGNDPSQIEISFGRYQGFAEQFGVIGNAPDPTTVDLSSGLVKYELGQIEPYSATTGLAWDRKSYLQHMRVRATGMSGTVLMQLVDTRSLKMEIFPGKAAGQVTGFDAGALMYER
jgi:hypothetical protein